ncbi:hypothetical protein HPC49_07865 [Pyxidicoccus fallax]|uniref:Lipoprotein n=1 Tax=Pyxidicoccus fallax TaxID=394095 RepID=A0A848LGG0_9BACT|nr:hypothetical protein [Pyxidicoccus fallax]NMO16365.1 hypothetical protein [Pyxidicoccus fallax]NPC78169.1 hypothetical protein [Pyxidicoccus fallax]
MHKGFIVGAIIAGVWGVACATRSKGAEAGEPAAVTESTGSCADNIDLEVDPKEGGGKTFNNKTGTWRLCSGGNLTVTNTLPKTACLDILNRADGGTYTTATLDADGGSWDASVTGKNDFELGVCNPQDGGPCSNGCPNMLSASGSGIDDTIKGNLDIVVTE